VLELVERLGLSCHQQPESHVKRAGLKAGLRGGERAVRPSRGISRQLERALQKRRGGSDAAPRLRAAG
jgi:hypothetical protein